MAFKTEKELNEELIKNIKEEQKVICIQIIRSYGLYLKEHIFVKKKCGIYKS